MSTFNVVENYKRKSVYFLPDRKNLIETLMFVVIIPMSHIKNKKKFDDFPRHRNSIHPGGPPCKQNYSLNVKIQYFTTNSMPCTDFLISIETLR